jgi:hypothetical protein
VAGGVLVLVTEMSLLDSLSGQDAVLVLLAVMLPFLVDLLVKSTASAWVKQTVTALLAALAGVAETGLTILVNGGDEAFNLGSAAWKAVLVWALSVLTYRNLLREHPLRTKLESATASFGLGRKPVPSSAPSVPEALRAAGADVKFIEPVSASPDHPSVMGVGGEVVPARQ